MSPAPSTPPARTSARSSNRTVDAAAEGSRGPALSDRSEAVLSGLWASLQGIVLSFAVVLLLAVVATLGASGDEPGSADPEGGGWSTGARVAAALWLLGHGVPLDAGAGTVTIIPLGIGALALFTTYIGAKRSALPTRAAWIAGTVLYAVATSVLAVLGDAAEGWRLALAPLAGLVVGGAGLALGMLAAPDAPRIAELSRRADRFVPDVVRLGARAGAMAVALLVAVAALLTGVWVVAGRATSDDIVASLEPGWLGGIVLAVAQVALLPNLVLWAAAWLAGPGFAVGQGTAFAPYETSAGPLPALPLLGALPGADWSGPASLWTPVVVVLCGVVAGSFAWRRLEPSLVRWADLGGVLAGAVLTAGVSVGVLQWWAGGAVAPGRLSDVGADPLLVGAVVAAEVGLGAAVVLTVAYLRTREAAADR